MGTPWGVLQLSMEQLKGQEERRTEGLGEAAGTGGQGHDDCPDSLNWWECSVAVQNLKEGLQVSPGALVEGSEPPSQGPGAKGLSGETWAVKTMMRYQFFPRGLGHAQ